MEIYHFKLGQARKWSHFTGLVQPLSFDGKKQAINNSDEYKTLSLLRSLSCNDLEPHRS